MTEIQSGNRISFQMIGSISGNHGEKRGCLQFSFLLNVNLNLHGSFAYCIKISRDIHVLLDIYLFEHEEGLDRPSHADHAVPIFALYCSVAMLVAHKTSYRVHYLENAACPDLIVEKLVQLLPELDV